MAYAEEEARRLVIEAGHRLVETGLIARTWGNISARISDTQFVITPSGLAYETLKAEQLVRVNIADCGYDPAEGKPSSEKGVHADGYRLRPEAQFIIHTHQDCASIVGLTGTDLICEGQQELGGLVPCAAYGMPGTKKLRRAVAAAVAAHPQSRAVLMLRHGALCLGGSMEETFRIADALEAVCREKLPPEEAAGALQDLGCSRRVGERFCLRADGTEQWYDVERRDLPEIAALHAAVYRETGTLIVRSEQDSAVTAVSREGKPMRPYLDDLCQIAGVTVRCAASVDGIGKALRGRNTVLLQGKGALCLGADEEDAEAVAMILRKGCRGQLYLRAFPNCRPLSPLDARLQRTIYTKKYSKQKQ